MNAGLLFRFLVGNRQAILDVAASPASIAPAFLFVLSAGFAREYDGEHILSAPWHFVRPVGASLITATALFLIVHVCTCAKQPRGGQRPQLRQAYTRFVTLFWWTAPMAWLYAIPYERFLGSVEAMEVNLWTLALVAGWRVLLMTRIVRVIYGIGRTSAFVLVMVFADAVALLAIELIPGPVLGLMGGIRYSEQDMILAAARINIQVFGMLLAPLILIAGIIVAVRVRPTWPALQDVPRTTMKGAKRIGLAALLIWIPLLPFTQAEQARKVEANRRFEEQGLEAGVLYMSEFERDDFPPHYDPPPRGEFYEGDSRGAKFAAVLRELQPPDWVWNCFVAKTEIMLAMGFRSFGPLSWQEIDEYKRSVDGTTQVSADSVWMRESYQQELEMLELLVARPREMDTAEAAALRSFIELRRSQVARMADLVEVEQDSNEE